MDQRALLAHARRVIHAHAAGALPQPSLWQLLPPGRQVTDWMAETLDAITGALDAFQGLPALPLLPPSALGSEPPAEPLVADVLRRGELLMLAGPPKSRKTWAALDLAIAVASGDRWLCEYEAGMRPRRVCYMDYECQQWLLHSRLATLMQGRLPERERALEEHLRVAPLRGQTSLTIQHLRERLVAAADATRAELVVVDTLTRSVALADENDNAEVTALGAALAEVAGETGAALVLVHHTAKGAARTRSVAESGSGAGAFGRIPDSVARLSLDEQGGSRLDLIARSFPPTLPMSVEWPMGSRPRARPVEEPPAAEPPAAPRRRSREPLPA